MTWLCFWIAFANCVIWPLPRVYNKSYSHSKSDCKRDFRISLSSYTIWFWDTKTYEFLNVEDLLAKEDSHAETCWPLELLVFIEITVGCIRQESQTRSVVVFIVFLAAVILSEHVCLCWVDLRVNVSHWFRLCAHCSKNFKAVVVLAEIKLLFSLTDPQKELSIDITLESVNCGIQEFYCFVEAGVLSGYLNSNDCVLEWVNFAVQIRDHSLVQLKQVSVLWLVKLNWLRVVD